MRRVASALLAALIMPLACAIATPASAATRTVRVGLYQNEPKVFANPADGKPSGIFVDLLEEVARQEGWELVWVPGTWDQGLAALTEGRIDLMPDVAYSSERDALFDFHKTPVVESWSHIYSAPGAQVDRFSQLDGKRVAVLKNSIQASALRQMAKGFGYDIEIVEASSLPNAFRMTADGKVDAAVANHLFGDYFYLKYGLAKTPIVFNAVPLFYATANGKNQDMLDTIDRRLNEWIGEPDSVYYQALERYTTKDRPGGVPEWVYWVLGAGAGLLVLSSGLAVLLRWQVAVKTRHLRLANEALSSAEEMLRLAVDAADEGIFGWYPKTGDVVWNPRCYSILGYEADEFLLDFEVWSGLVHPDDRDLVIDSLRRIDAGEHGFELEFRMKGKSGGWVWLGSRGEAVAFDEDGQAERVVGVNMDISKRKQAEEDVLRLNAELEQRVAERTSRLAMANQDLESFSYSVSHDLRAPLRAISGFAQIIARRHRDDLNEEGRHYVDNIVQASERMGQLIDNLLTFSRLGRQSVHIQPVALGGLVDAIASDLAARLDEVGGSLKMAEDLPTIAGDATLLSQILTNLLDNAVKYRKFEVPLEIVLGWREDGSDVVLSVHDNGIGIAKDYQDKVFNIFQRLHSDDDIPGTGIGLANVKKCVDLLSGTVWLESAEGEGTTFFVRLPKER